MAIRSIKLSGAALDAALALKEHDERIAAEVTAIGEDYKRKLAAIQAESNKISLPLMITIHGEHGIDTNQNLQTQEWSVLNLAEDSYLISTVDPTQAAVISAAANARRRMN